MEVIYLSVAFFFSFHSSLCRTYGVSDHTNSLAEKDHRLKTQIKVGYEDMEMILKDTTIYLQMLSLLSVICTNDGIALSVSWIITLIIPLVSPIVGHWTKHVSNYWMDHHQIWLRHSCSPVDDSFSLRWSYNLSKCYSSMQHCKVLCLIPISCSKHFQSYSWKHTFKLSKPVLFYFFLLFGNKNTLIHIPQM